DQQRPLVKTIGRNLISGERCGDDRRARLLAAQRVLQCGWNGRKIARAHGGSHGGSEGIDGAPRFEPFVVRHEEQSVPAIEQLGDADRAGEREAVLILAVGRFVGGKLGWALGVFEEIRLGVKAVVAEEFEGRSVIFVAAAFRRHVHLPGCASEFGWIDTGLYLNSCNASTDGSTMYRLKLISVFVMPSSV